MPAAQKVMLIVLVIALVLILLLTVGAGMLIYGFIFDRSSPIHMSKTKNPTNDDVMLRSGAGGTLEDWAWFETGERMTITAAAGVELVARYVPDGNGSHRYVITCHGTGGCGKHMSGYGRKFQAMGFNVLMPDSRAHGESGGDLFGFGWSERLDVLAWARALIDLDPEAEIVLHGASLGAGTVLMAAGETLPPNIKAVISDSGYTTAYEQMSSVVPWIMKPGVWVASQISKAKAGFSFQQASAIDQIRHSQVPILFIQGDQDSVVSFEMLDQLYNAANCEKEKLAVSGADHTLSYVKDPETYWNTVKAFVDVYT